MVAFSSIIMGISALSGIKANQDAKKAARQQADAQRQQATTARERAALEAQGRSTERTDVVLGSMDSTAGTAAAAGKPKKIGTPVGGILGSGTNIGGL
jgi:hypothetical protein